MYLILQSFSKSVFEPSFDIFKSSHTSNQSQQLIDLYIYRGYRNFLLAKSILRVKVDPIFQCFEKVNFEGELLKT